MRLRALVLKVASNCNLRCSYCYVYEHADQTWREQPWALSEECAIALGKRIREHSELQGFESFDLVLHGGEPTLLPASRLQLLLRAIVDAAAPIRVDFDMQTNGTRISSAYLEVLREFNCPAAVSIDGPREHNALRVDQAGRPSFEAAVRGMQLLSEPPDGSPSLLAGVLAVANPRIPVQTMTSFLDELPTSQVDVLFPDLNHDSRTSSDIATRDIGHWYCDLFDEWFHEDRSTSIRLFSVLVSLILGSGSGFDSIGPSAPAVGFVETDGTYQALDTLKTCYTGANHTGLTVWDNSLAELEQVWAIRAASNKAAHVCSQCAECPILDVCGGGYLPHRYSSKAHFENPSVFCGDIQLLVSHISSVLLGQMSQ